nr:unnamed protein product [uncultured bacterium]
MGYLVSVKLCGDTPVDALKWRICAENHSAAVVDCYDRAMLLFKRFPELFSCAEVETISVEER